MQVFPELYLPVMTENNLRVLKPWRSYIPSLSQLQHKAKVCSLNSYIKRLLHKRWAEKQQSSKKGTHTGKEDVLERIMQALEVCAYSTRIMIDTVHVCPAAIRLHSIQGICWTAKQADRVHGCLATVLSQCMHEHSLMHVSDTTASSFKLCQA